MNKLNFLEMQGLYAVISLAHCCSNPNTKHYDILRKLDNETWTKTGANETYTKEELTLILPQINKAKNSLKKSGGEDDLVAHEELNKAYKFLKEYLK